MRDGVDILELSDCIFFGCAAFAGFTGVAAGLGGESFPRYN